MYQSIPVFLDIVKLADFRWKNADISKTQGVCHVINRFLDLLEEGVTVSIFFIVGYEWLILGRGGGFWPPPFLSSPKKANPE